METTAKLAEFARWVLENGSFAGCDIDGADAQEKAAALGLIEPDQTRPDWWVYTDAFRVAFRGEGEQARTCIHGVADAKLCDICCRYR